jgi:hypothetical protein
MSRFAVFFVLLLIAVPYVFSVPLDNLVPSARVSKLRSDDSLIVETQLRSPSLKLIPQDAELRQKVNAAITVLNPNIMVEIMYLYMKPAHAQTSPDVWDETQKIGIYNQIMSISTMTGLKYRSSSRGEMRTFFELAQVVDNAKKPLPDPVFTTPPEELVLLARQKDLTFGDNIYRYDYTVTPQAVFFIQENVTSLTVALVPVIGKGNLQSVMAVFDCGDSLLIYAISMAKSFNVPGIWERISDSFTSRAEALLSWFTGRADLVFFN